MNITFAGKTVMVTGAAHGFGRAISRAFAERGAAVWACDVIDDELRETEQLCREAGGVCHAVRADVRNHQAVADAVANASAASGRVDILVNNAGGVCGQVGRPLEEITPADWQVIFDVKSTRNLFDWIRRHGGTPVLWKTGHSLIKAKMKETGALLAGEMSGHTFFKERWYGFDDGLYAGARLLECLSASADIEAEFARLPDSVNTPELQIQLAEGENHALIAQLQRVAKFSVARDVITIDGLRVEYADGFGLARASNTTPVIVLRFEADDTAALRRIQDDFRRVLLAAKPDAHLPF